MKKLKYLILLCSLFLLLFSCKDESFVKIDSLQVLGEEFYYGQTVNIAMSVKTSDPDNTTYFWECDGGTLLNRQGYTLNQWKAPRVSGRYKVRCTVTCNDEKQTREAEIFVNGFFFQRFESGEGTNTLPTGWGQDYSQPQIRNHRLELQVNNNAQSHGTARYAFGQSNMYPPFSVKADVGIVGETAASVNNFNPKYPNSDKSNPNSFASRFPNADNWCAIAITGNTLSADTITHFINEVRVIFYPEADHALPEMKFLKRDGDPTNPADTIAIAKSDFDAIFTFQVTRKANIGAGIPQQQVTYGIPFKASSLIYGVEDPHTIGLSVDMDYNVSVAANGAVIFTTDAIKTWRESFLNTEGRPSAAWAASQFRYYYPTATRVFLDNVIAYLEANYGGI